MASPVRFPQGLNTFAPRHMLNTFPVATSPDSVVVTEDFLPYRAGDYTVTQTNGSATTFGWPAGAVKLATTGATAADNVYLSRSGSGFQPILGNRFWANFRVAYPRTVGNTNDTNIYIGWFDNVNPASATNAVYFFKPAGGTSVNFIIKKFGVTTTFQNVADLALPSGLFGDTNSVNGTIAATVAGNILTTTSVATPGAGYQVAPLVLSTAASGAAGLVPVFVQLASTANSQTNPQVPIQTTGIPYASLSMPYVVNGAAGSFTNSGSTTTYLEAEPVIDLGFYFDQYGRLYVGVNGRTVMSIIGKANELGVTGIAGGGTSNVATAGPSYYSTTQLSTSVAPFQPPVGNAYNILPTVPLAVAVGFANTTANARAFYVTEYYSAIELN